MTRNPMRPPLSIKDIEQFKSQLSEKQELFVIYVQRQQELLQSIENVKGKVVAILYLNKYPRVSDKTKEDFLELFDKLKALQDQVSCMDFKEKNDRENFKNYSQQFDELKKNAEDLEKTCLLPRTSTKPNLFDQHSVTARGNSRTTSSDCEPSFLKNDI